MVGLIERLTVGTDVGEMVGDGAAWLADGSVIGCSVAPGAATVPMLLRSICGI